MPERTIPVVLLGGTGYVTGELLRLLALHPVFAVRAVASTSHVGAAVTETFPHLAGTRIDRLRFAGEDEILGAFERGAPCGILAATPHGATAPLLDRVLRAAEDAGADARAVDLSAEFRYADTARYERVYGHPHGAPARAAEFTCAVPELYDGRPPRHATQPGCFTTAVVLAAHPLLALGLVTPDVFASAVTGSSGSGRTPAANTHHPGRRSALYAYAPLAHRHEPEMRMLLGRAAGGDEPHVDFVPHSGPFVRGIHATLRLTLREPLAAEDVVARFAAFYDGAPFVSVSTSPPTLTEVVGTNRCRIGIATRGTTLVATSVIDNLVKGAAGGGVQWCNRLFGLPDDTGLRVPGLGWY